MKILFLISLSFLCVLEGRSLWASDMEWSGFLSSGVVRSNSNAVFNDGIDSELNYIHDFRAGVNMSSQLTDDLSAMFQVLSKGQNEDFSVELDWALMQYRPVSAFSIRIGKQKLSTWLVSEYIDVGALYPWIRPPTVVYGFNRATTFVGPSLEWRYPVSTEWSLVTEVYGGWSPLEKKGSQPEVSGRLKNTLGISSSLGNDFVSVRASFARTDALLRARTIQEQAVAVNTVVQTDLMTSIDLGPTYFVSSGLRIDWKEFLFLTEFAYLKSRKQLLERAHAVYATLGHSFFDQWIFPHFTFQKVWEKNNFVFPGTEWSTTLGLNIKTHENLVVKTEWQRVDSKGASSFSVDPGKAVNIYGINANLIF